VTARRRSRVVKQPEIEIDEDKPRSEEKRASDDVWPRLQRHSRGLDDVLAPLAKIVLFVTILLGGYQYFYAQQELRVDRTLEYVAEWNSGRYRDAFDELNQVIWPIYSAAAAEIDALASTPEQRNDMLANIGEQVTNPGTGIAPNAAAQVDQVFSFFERAALCANERLCDFQVLDTFLGNEVRSFWTYFSRYARLKNSTGYTTYGYWTSRFAVGEIAGRRFFGVF
jgi:hypothetical protein